MDNNRYCVILCGGIGSRFWPFSREARPKQFIDFLGTGRSLLQMTIDRIRPLVPMENVFLMTNKAYADMIREQLPEVPRENILLEPSRRNTSPCVCWAAHHIYARNPEASMVVLPSDHIILKENEFQNVIEEGLTFVETHPHLLTIGNNPRYPHTGYGYIQATTACIDFPNILKVKTFTEKPDLEMAKLFLSTGEFYWNAGIFLWKAKTILDAFAKHDPDTAIIFNQKPEVYDTELELAFIEKEYPNATNISIDYAIMERASNVFVRTVDFGWSDLGTWNALHEISPKTQEGNVTQNCKVMAHECSGNVFAIKGDKIVVAEGLKDYIIADTENVLLIVPRSEEQRIRNIVNDVKNRFGSEYI